MVEPMKILVKSAKTNDPSVYKYKPRTIPVHIRKRAKELLMGLEKQGIIRKLGVNEPSQFCAQAGFVPKKSNKLRFVIDFSSLCWYIRSCGKCPEKPIKLISGNFLENVYGILGQTRIDKIRFRI